MASQTQGIQQLLTAEKRAAEKVAEARKRKYKFKNDMLLLDALRYFWELNPLSKWIIRWLLIIVK